MSSPKERSKVMASTESPTPAIFSPFPRLPIEIRDAIWELSLPASRILTIYAEHGKIMIPGRKKRRDSQKYTHVYARKVPVPVILHICQESRRLGLRHYELVFDSNPRPAKENLPDLHHVPGRRQVEFPFDTKAMMYVDLERDVLVTGHRKHIGSRGANPKDDPKFKDWPVHVRNFDIVDFKKVVPREVLERIRTFAVTFALSIVEIFPVRFGIGLGSKTRVLVVKNPFEIVHDGEDRIEKMKWMRIPGPEYKGKFRSLRNLAELDEVVEERSLWDWAVDKEYDEGQLKAARRAVEGIGSDDEDEDE